MVTGSAVIRKSFFFTGYTPPSLFYSTFADFPIRLGATAPLPHLRCGAAGFWA